MPEFMEHEHCFCQEVAIGIKNIPHWKCCMCLQQKAKLVDTPSPFPTPIVWPTSPVEGPWPHRPLRHSGLLDMRID